MALSFSYNAFTLCYRIYGNGSKHLLALHGFGRTGEDFESFSSELENNFTIYAFDLFYHGESKTFFEKKIPSFDKKELEEFFSAFLEAKNIDRFSIIAYSLGGRFALCMTERFAHRVNDLFLMAPDGLRFDFWHFFVTRTSTGQWLFKSVIENPEWILSLASLLGKTKLVNHKMVQFVRSHLEEKAIRQKVYCTWMITRDLVPDLALASKEINSGKINVQMFFGRHDVIIKPALGKKFLRLLSDKSCLHILDCGHKGMKPDSYRVKEILLPLIFASLESKKNPPHRAED